MQPTNDLDLATLRVLEAAFTDFAGTLMIVSHDRWFESGYTACATRRDDPRGRHAHFPL